jgi:uncharacterized protein
MLKLSLTELARGEASVRGEIPPDDPLWQDADLVLLEPLRVELDARSVGEGVLVRGTMRTRLQLECRRCVTTVPYEVNEPVDLLFEPLEGDEAEDLSGEVYPLPERGADLHLQEPLREQLVLRVPLYVVCAEECQGLCPQCGADLNESPCGCTPAAEPGPWEALKKIKFD